MQTPILCVEPSISIEQASALAQEVHQDFIGYRLELTAGEAVMYVAHRDDLEKMDAMGLAHLPVDCVAIPEASPLLLLRHDERVQGGGKADYSRRLTEYFPVYFVAALYELQSLMLRHGMKGYVIGGITRNLLLFNDKRLSVTDVDITVEGDAIELASFLTENSRNFELVEAFPEFGTAKLRYKEKLLFDVASTRQEIYPHCGALPVVVKRGVPLQEDVVRRDFSINALAFSIHELGQILDHSDGMRDIERRQIRVLHPVSFFEDPSRILRALKFCARFDFDLAEETRYLIERFLAVGGHVYKGGGERIKQELKGFFSVEESPAKSHWLRVFMAKGYYRLLNMEVTYQAEPDALSRLTGLASLLPVIESTLSVYLDADFAFDTHLCFLFRDWPLEEFQKTALRLGLTKNERETVEQFRRLKDSVRERFGGLHEFSSPADIYDLFHGLPLITVVACLVELGFTAEAQMKIVLEAFLRYKRKWEKLELELDGNDLMGLGVPEGKLIGQLLDQLLHAKLAGHVPDRMDEIHYVREQLGESLPAPSHLSAGPWDESPVNIPELLILPDITGGAASDVVPPDA